MRREGWVEEGVGRYIACFNCFNRDRILQIQGVHRSLDLARVLKSLEKKGQISMKLQCRDGTGLYVRGIETVEFLGTGVRMLRNPLEPGCPRILRHI